VTTCTDGICVHGQPGSQGDSRRWIADRLLIGTSPRPALADLNLPAVGLRLKNQAILVNRYLQTRHPYIYACGAVLGGDCLPVVARHEAAVAVDNALFWNRRTTRYDQLPYTLLTQPEFCRVGMTIAQAQQRYGPKAVNSYDAVLDGNRKAQALGNTTGFCRLVTHRRGHLLGAHLVGLQASEWGQVLAIARQHRFTLQDLAQLPTLPQTLTDLVRQAAAPWERDRWQPGQWRRDWAENWFNWRRSR
jgi:pyruvate/2-oxoglutarate dehydrogenase complex dihydrolipoamide dehydrogenase (E3) component